MDRWYRTARGRIIVGLAVLALAVGGVSLVRAAVNHEDPHEHIAQSEADRILTTFVPPPGASKASSRPHPLPKTLEGPQEWSAAETVATSIGWYYTTESPGDVLDWVKAHPPTGSTCDSGGYGSNITPYLGCGCKDSIPASVLSSRELLVTPDTGADGRTIIRLDAVVIWIPSRSSDSVVRSGAASATIVTTNPMMNPRLSIPAAALKPITTTDPAIIKAITDAINALPPVVPSSFGGCGRDDGVRLHITLPGVADILASPAGCGDVTVTIDGEPRQRLSGGQDFAVKIYVLLGVTWSYRE